MWQQSKGGRYCMKKYHKIVTVLERDPKSNFRTLLEGRFAMPEFEYLQNNDWIWSEKVDGMCIRVVFNGEIEFKGKTDNAQIPASLVNKLNDQFLPLKDTFAEIFANGVCLYGEGYGANIQKGGGNYRQDQGFVLFDVKIDKYWLERKNVEDISDTLGVEVVPIIGSGTLHEMIEYTKIGFQSQWGNFTAEGIVARPAIELKARNEDRIITKIKFKDFPYREKND